MREIVSVSLGPQANFTSAHFWNFQDEQLKCLKEGQSCV